MLLAGQDLIGQAQTGTGKTAAFALPFLSMLDVARREPQVLVLVPTRELAIQVAEAFQKYAAKLPGLHVLPIYGGQSYTPQLNALRRGTHVIVGTPGTNAEGCADATPSAFRRPALSSGVTAAELTNSSCTSFAVNAVSAWVAPLYGT